MLRDEPPGSFAVAAVQRGHGKGLKMPVVLDVKPRLRPSPHDLVRLSLGLVGIVCDEPHDRHHP